MPDDDLIAELNTAAKNWNGVPLFARAAARLTAAAGREQEIREEQKDWARRFKLNDVTPWDWMGRATRAEASLTAAAERERRLREALREALRELLAALDNNANSTEFGDDVSAMLRYGEAETAARAALASAWGYEQGARSHALEVAAIVEQWYDGSRSATAALQRIDDLCSVPIRALDPAPDRAATPEDRA